VECTKGAQQRALPDAGNTTEVPDVHTLAEVGARHGVELIDDPLMALDPASR
jgi:hypothetical protein